MCASSNVVEECRFSTTPFHGERPSGIESTDRDRGEGGPDTRKLRQGLSAGQGLVSAG